MSFEVVYVDPPEDRELEDLIHVGKGRYFDAKRLSIYETLFDVYQEGRGFGRSGFFGTLPPLQSTVQPAEPPAPWQSEEAAENYTFADVSLKKFDQSQTMEHLSECLSLDTGHIKGSGAFQVPIFNESFCQRLIKEVEAIAAYSKITLDEKGLHLVPFGFQSWFDGFLAYMQLVFREQVHPELALTFAAGFAIQYRPGEAHMAHIDGADVTFNICLGSEFSGGDLCVSFNDAQTSLQHVPGRMIIHNGHQRHHAEALLAGLRTNLIVWARAALPFHRFCELPVDLRCLVLSFAGAEAASRFRLCSKASRDVGAMDAVWQNFGGRRGGGGTMATYIAHRKQQVARSLSSLLTPRDLYPRKETMQMAREREIAQAAEGRANAQDILRLSLPLPAIQMIKTQCNKAKVEDYVPPFYLPVVACEKLIERDTTDMLGGDDGDDDPYEYSSDELNDPPSLQLGGGAAAPTPFNPFNIVPTPFDPFSITMQQRPAGSPPLSAIPISHVEEAPQRPLESPCAYYWPGVREKYLPSTLLKEIGDFLVYEWGDALLLCVKTQSGQNNHSLKNTAPEDLPAILEKSKTEYHLKRAIGYPFYKQ